MGDGETDTGVNIWFDCHMIHFVDGRVEYGVVYSVVRTKWSDGTYDRAHGYM